MPVHLMSMMNINGINGVGDNCESLVLSFANDPFMPHTSKSRDSYRTCQGQSPRDGHHFTANDGWNMGAHR